MAVTIEEGRIEGVLRVVVAAVHGDYDPRVPLSDEHGDAFLEVEVGVNYLLEELSERRAANDRQREALAAHAEQLGAQQDALVAALSTPIIEVWPGVLALPIIGRVDDARAAMITSRLLERVAGNRASHVILDLTGVAAIDVETMPAIVRMIRAIGLLGTECMLTGIGPEVARQVVQRGVDATRIRVAGQLSDALAAVLAEKGALRR
ncbi:MAG: STAS domain-containing protein [Myxococcales bacterium]|nr:STAS domain-containing protein [Myxococcales bacterium]